MEESKKIKNLISIIILLVGLFVGSLFVDILQMVKGSGFSERSLKNSDIFESNGKTWVAYTEPKVKVQVLTDDACQNCDPTEALVWLRRVMPTINAAKVDANSNAGKELALKFGIKTIPAFVFDDAVSKTDFFAQAKILFDQKEGGQVLKTQDLGLAPGKYLDLPKIQDGDATFGKEDANVKVVIYSDFQCPYCKVFWATLRSTMKQYQDKVLFDYKHLPLDFHPQAENAALASACAQEQNKFWEYGDRLFNAQSDWSKATGTQKFKDYARMLGMNAQQFNQCLDSKKYQNKINDDKAEAAAFGISGTPAAFIDSQFKNGAISASEFKSAIEDELNK